MRSEAQSQVWTGYLYLEIGLKMIIMCVLFTPTPTPPTAFDSVDETLREMCPRVTNL